MNYNLLQNHTVELYKLRDYTPEIISVPAKSLLTPKRFDLFAKLYYISNRDNNYEVSLNVYVKHILAFNPDGQEPGRDDKIEIKDFVVTFDKLITDFKSSDFDDNKSIIPVDKNGIILDGAHRLATLAYYDKNVTIAKFSNIEVQNHFDYEYFMKRGLAWDICDMIALEMTKWLDNLLVACLWPRIGSKKIKEDITKKIGNIHYISYIKKIHVSLRSISNFVSEIYSQQSWTQNEASVMDKAARVYGNGGAMLIVFFENKNSLNDIIKEKENLRLLYKKGKDSIHITDNKDETIEIANLVLLESKIESWNNKSSRKLIEIIEEKWFYFKKIYWINFKVFIAKHLYNK